MIYDIVPVPKPRMTVRDKWKKRPVVMRYRAFKDECFARNVSLPLSGALVTFVLPMPKSWSRKKRLEMDGQPHQVRPDLSNLIKALEDAVLVEDSPLWHLECRKVWGFQGRIEIE